MSPRPARDGRSATPDRPMHPTCPFGQQTSQGAQAAAHGTQTRWERTVCCE